MKTFRLSLGILLVLAMGGFLLRAQRSAAFDREAVRLKGKEIVASATSTLSSNLMHAITRGGMTNAITFCSMHALPLTDSAVSGESVLLRRVSTRVRNPHNSADGIERRIIEQYERQLQEGITPGPVVEVYQDEARYFEPIVLANALCLSCHGDPATQIKPQTRELIEKLYPKDEGTGFKLNELRGIWSITFRKPFPSGDKVQAEPSLLE